MASASIATPSQRSGPADTEGGRSARINRSPIVFVFAAGRRASSSTRDASAGGIMRLRAG